MAKFTDGYLDSRQGTTGNLDDAVAASNYNQAAHSGGRVPSTIDPNAAFRGREGGTALLARLSRAKWDDWLTTFSPYVDRLRDVAESDGFVQRAGADAANASDDAFNNAEAGLALQESRTGAGLQMDADEKGARDRSFALARAGSKTSASNSARMAATDLQRKVLAGGAAATLPDEQ